MAVYVCRRCSYEAAELWLEECPGCGGLYRAKKVGVDTAEQKARSTFARAEEAKIDYVPTGVVGFDRTIHPSGGGLVRGKTILFGGMRGAGKSSILCLVADAVARSRGSALYASSEEDSAGVLSIAHRVGVRSEHVEVLGSQSSIVDVIEHARKTRPFLFIADSLQMFARNLVGGEEFVMKQVIEYARETKTCAIVVSQMTKGGELRGSAEGAHACDAVLVLAYPKDDDEDVPEVEGVRCLVVDGKNRIGPDSGKTYWKFHDETSPTPGLIEHIPARSRLIEEPRRKYARRGEN